MSPRVVVTGMAGITALGEDWQAIEAGLRRGKNGVRRMAEWERYESLHTRLGAPVEGWADFERYVPISGALI